MVYLIKSIDLTGQRYKKVEWISHLAPYINLIIEALTFSCRNKNLLEHWNSL